MIYCFDLDDTLCRTEGMDYENAKPIQKRLDRVNKLYDEGHTIITVSYTHLTLPTKA